MAASLTDPNLAFLLIVAGLLGTVWEFHAPGAIVPGIIGLILLLLGCFGLAQDAPTWYGSSLLLGALLLLAAEVKFGSYGVSGVLGAILLFFGASSLLPSPRRIEPTLSLAASLAFFTIAVFLGYLGVRARQTKDLSALENMVGGMGVARTEVFSRGTVFVRGEYWQATSQKALPAGTPVRVLGIDGLILYVEEA